MPTLPGNFLLGQAVHELDIEHLPSMISHGTNGFQRNLQIPGFRSRKVPLITWVLALVKAMLKRSRRSHVILYWARCILWVTHHASRWAWMYIARVRWTRLQTQSSVRVSSGRFFGSSAGTCCSKSETLLQIWKWLFENGSFGYLATTGEARSGTDPKPVYPTFSSNSRGGKVFSNFGAMSAFKAFRREKLLSHLHLLMVSHCCSS